MASPVSEKAIPPSDAEIAFQKAVNNGSIEDLVKCAKNHPESREIVTDFLTWDIRLDSLGYNEIIHYFEMVENDSLLMSPFLFYKDSIEEKVISELSELGIDEVIEYYNSHPESSIFIRQVINDAISESVKEADYYSIKYMHQAFENSIFSDNIDSCYDHLRDSLLNGIIANINEYELSVKEVAQSVMSQVYHELDSITQSSIFRVLQDCLEKELPRRDKKAKERVELIYKTFVNSSGARKSVQNNVQSFASTVNESVQELFQSIVIDSENKGPISSEAVVPSVPVYNILMNDFLEFSDVQRSIDWVSVGLTTVSIVADLFDKTGSISGLLDVADFGYGAVSDVKKGKKCQAALKKLGASMYSNMDRSNISAVSATSSLLDNFISSTFTNLRIAIHEEF